MPVRSTKGSANDFPAGSVAASGNNNGGIAVGVNHDHVQDAGSRNMSSGVPIVDFADKFDDVTGSIVVANIGTGAATTDRVGVSGAVAGTATDGTKIAFTPNATQWVMQGGNVTTTLGGAANTVLAGGARDYSGDLNDAATEVARTKINDRKLGSKSDEAYDTLARPSTQIVPGRTKGTGAGNSNAFQNTTDTTVAVTTEIAPSRSVPGELTYFFGGVGKPTTDEYKAKDAFEAADDTSS